MEYILFDDCYMSSIEVAYELKDVTKYLIGSTSEMMHTECLMRYWGIFTGESRLSIGM